ncbi:MAG: alpha-2-macroglobulin, partial [Candidatus Sericytochromatia bacterium]
LGGYSFQFRHPQDNMSLQSLGATSFQVEEYKKPEYEVNIAPKPALPGDTAHVGIKANYFFGGPVAGAKVEYTVTRQQYWPYFYSEYDWEPRPRSGNEVVLKTTGNLDAQGQLEISFPTLADTDSVYHIEAQVSDASRREVSQSGQLIVTRLGFFASIRLDQGFYQSGDRVSGEIQLKDPNGRPVAKQAGTVLVERIKAQNGDKLETETVYTQPVTSDASGRVFVRWLSSIGGKYRLRFEALDKREQKVGAIQEFWVAGEGFAGTAIRLNGVELVTDKRSYSPGDTVEVLVQTDKPDSHVWLTQESDDAILRSELLSLHGRSQIQRFVLKDQHQPNFMLRALTVADRALHSDERELFVPALQHQLQISLTPDQASYAPGSSGRLKIQVRDNAGKPVETELSLAMVDAALYQLLPDSTQPIHDALYGARRSIPQRLDSSLNVGFSAFVDYLAKMREYQLKSPFTMVPGLDQMHSRYREEDGPVPAPTAEAAMSLDGFADDNLRKTNTRASEPGQAPPRVRAEFKDTAYWNPAIVTNPQGLAELKLDYPDNLTTWRFVSRGWNAGAKVGQAQAEVKTRQDLMLRLQHPRFLTERDEVVISANLNNDMAQAEAVSVKLQIDPARLGATGPLEQKITVPAKGQARVDWRLKVLTPGSTTLMAEAKGAHAGDAMRESLPVQIYGGLKTETHSGSTKGNATETLVLPAARKPEQTQLRITLQPSLAATLLDALPYLAEYPYGCIEQTTSRFVPAVLVAKTLGELGIDLDTLGKQLDVSQKALRVKQPLASRQELQKMIDEGLRRLISGQNADGGWGWWPGGTSDPYMSSYVLDALLLATDADLKLEPGMLERGLNFLEAKFKDAEKDTDNLHLHTYQAYVLARGKRLSADRLKPLFEQRDELNAYSKALLAMAHHYAGDGENARLILQNLKSFVRRDAKSATASWDNAQSWWYWYGDRVETNATILQAFNLISPADSLVPEIMRWLVYNREGNRWHSTKDTARAIYALSGYLRQTRELKADYSVSVKLNGKLLQQVRFTPDKALAGPVTVTLADKDLAVGENRIELVKTGEGTLYYSTALQVFSREDKIPAAGNRLEVQRTYTKVVDQLNPETKKVDTLRTPLAEGALLTSGEEVEVRLEIKAPNDYEYLLFEDFKPAGFEAVDTLSG